MLFERLITGEKEDRRTAETKGSDYNEKTNEHFNMFQIPCINQTQKYINDKKKCISIFYNVFHSRYSHQHVSAGITAIFRVIFFLQECNCG